MTYSYGSIDDEYSQAETNYYQAQQLISGDRSQAKDKLYAARNLLSNCNSPKAKQLAEKVQNLLNQYGG